jgi:hypothetical protein
MRCLPRDDDVPRLVDFIRVMRNVNLSAYFDACLVDRVVGREVWIGLG